MSSGKQCHVCGKMGHVSKECSQRTCRICGGKGHVAATCIKNPANAVRKCRKCGKSGHFESDCHSFSDQRQSVCSKCGGPHELYACTMQNICLPVEGDITNSYATCDIFLSNLPSRMTKANCNKMVARYGTVASLHWVAYSLEDEKKGAKAVESQLKATSNGTDDAADAKEASNGDGSAHGEAEKETHGAEEELVGCFVTFENAQEADAAVEKMHGKKVLGRRCCAWHMATVTPLVIDHAINGRLGAVERHRMTSKKHTEEMVREMEINAVQARLATMEKNMRNTSTLEDGSRTHNKEMFGANKQGGGGGVWNGAGMTKTEQCPTLIVTNVPRSVREDQVKGLFQKCQGFFAMRCVRGLYFVDYNSIGDATNAMIKNQNYVFEGHNQSLGLAIDYDKDTRSKRNKQYERSRNVAAAPY